MVGLIVVFSGGLWGIRVVQELGLGGAGLVRLGIIRIDWWSRGSKQGPIWSSEVTRNFISNRSGFSALTGMAVSLPLDKLSPFSFDTYFISIV